MNIFIHENFPIYGSRFNASIAMYSLSVVDNNKYGTTVNYACGMCVKVQMTQPQKLFHEFLQDLEPQKFSPQMIIIIWYVEISCFILLKTSILK